MYSLDINPGDAKELLKYEEIGWFLKEAYNIKNNREINNMLRIAEAVRVGTIGASNKKGYDAYYKWKKNFEDFLKPGEAGEVKTLFDTFKEKKKHNKLFTLFDRLRGK